MTEELKLINERLARIEEITLLASKEVLTVDEAVSFSGFSKYQIYQLTAERKLPFSKPNGKKIFFRKSELEQWLLQNRVATVDEINAQAATYIATKKFK